MPRLPLVLAPLSLALLLAVPAPAQDAPAADLAVQKDVYEGEVLGEEEAVFFIAVTNDGPGAATDVAVADVLPEGLVFAAAHATRGSYDPASGTWTVGTLAAGRTETLELTVVAAAEGLIQNCASVSASGQRDPNAANDADCAYVYVRPKREKMVPLALHGSNAVIAFMR